jgi:DNA-binding protein
VDDNVFYNMSRESQEIHLKAQGAAVVQQLELMRNRFRSMGQSSRAMSISGSIDHIETAMEELGEEVKWQP